MKNSIWHLSLVLLVGFGLTSILPTNAYGQDTTSSPNPGNAPSGFTPHSPNSRKQAGQQTSGVIGQPHAGAIVESEEIMRYTGLFTAIRGWDWVAKSMDEKGEDHGMAEAWRTRLEKQSGLTASESEEVKKIAYQWLKDDAEFGQRFVEAGNRAHAAHPNEAAGGYPTPEIDAMRQESIDIANKAIIDLLRVLGSRSFSKLDLFTRHMDDWLKSMQTPVQSTEGVSPQ
jgi:hypothetical protein